MASSDTACTAAEKSRPTTCAVCLEEAPHALMPCCGKDGSTTGYCRRCIELICEHNQGVGRCPSCRKYIIIDSTGKIVVTDKHGQCRMCRQWKTLIDQGQCDACLLGQRFPLKYECDRCHRVQQIPHPMWRYQPAPTEFGGATWACHKGCGDYTHWRVIAQDLPRVPAFDYPESWGRDDEWLDRVRRQRSQERSQGISSNGAQQTAQGTSSSGCTIS